MRQTEFHGIWNEDKGEPTAKREHQESAQYVTTFTNPCYDCHEFRPSGWIPERLVMAMGFDVVLESNI